MYQLSVVYNTTGVTQCNTPCQAETCIEVVHARCQVSPVTHVRVK